MVKKMRPVFSLFKHILRWAGRLFLMLVIADLIYLAFIWPDWDKHESGEIQRSSFIKSYESEQPSRSDWPNLRWNPVPIKQISRNVIRAVIVAEDSRFYQHGGVDFEAFKEAMQTNLSKGRMAYGASTISQQTTKNLFLSASRNPLRKWHELLLTYGMENNLSKKRILEHYLNLAEFGRGIYGVESAARFYWGISASQLSVAQAIELAASLPSPVKHNPGTRTRAFQNRVRKIKRNFRRSSL